MILDYELLKDKILGCYNGKNAGGVLGAPFECYRGTFKVDYYTQKNIDNNPPPNDDLDLQLLWLNAVETFGNKVTADILADYWLTYIVPVWSEYGIAKANLKRGLRPPFSGKVDNYYGESNGAYIRSEIWACLAPGNPEIAAHFAYMDACVDHCGEGVWGEMFFASLESAAFVISNRDKLVDIGLSYIPKDCRLAKAIAFVRELYSSGVDFDTARVRVMNEFPGSFGIAFKNSYEMEIIKKNYGDYDLTSIGDDVINTIALTVLAWYYGEDDFEKSICLATLCGEDADCTASTLGALLGIINGNSRLPEKWIKPIGNIINTVCISTTITKRNAIPSTTVELTDRILNAIPKFLDRGYYTVLPEFTVKTQDEFLGINVTPGGRDFTHDERFMYKNPYPFYFKNGGRNCNEFNFNCTDIINAPAHSVLCVFDTIKAVVSLDKEPFVSEGESVKISVRVMDNGMLRMQNHITVAVYTGAGLKVEGAPIKTVSVHNAYEADGVTEFTITAEGLVKEENTVLVDFKIAGRHSGYTARLTLLSR